jgi:hypothetical protein
LVVYYDCHSCHNNIGLGTIGVTWGVGVGAMLSQYFVYLRIGRGQIKENLGESGRKGCMYIKGWFKPASCPFLLDFSVN